VLGVVFVFTFAQTLCLYDCTHSSCVNHCCQSGSKSPSPAKSPTCLWKNAADIQKSAKAPLPVLVLKVLFATQPELIPTSFSFQTTTALLSSAPRGRLHPEFPLGKSARSHAPPQSA
jgi:hypothetical protein